MSFSNRGRRWTLSVVLLAGCDGDDRISNINEYIQGLPPWTQASPPREAGTERLESDASVCPDGELDGGVCFQEVIDTDVPIYGDAGALLGYGQQEFTCTTTRYRLTQTPELLVMLSPNAELLWPGALFQGKSFIDGQGELLPLPIKQRAPLKVSIPALSLIPNFEAVDEPDLAEVQQAIGRLVANASASHLKTPSTISFTMRTYSSEEEFALSAGLSAKYFGFRASASTSVKRSSSEHTVAVVLREKMFEVVVEPPQTPERFFSADFTPALLEEQEKLGRIGEDNPPVYLSNVVYGRLMMFTFTSTASETQIKAALNAAYRGLVFSGSVSLNAEYHKVLSEGRIAVTSLGGDAAATAEMIASGDWRAYFRSRECTESDAGTDATSDAGVDATRCTERTNNPPLTTAAPLSYTFRTLSDGRIAKTSETIEYDLRECVPKGETASFVLSDFDGNPAPSGAMPEPDLSEGWSVAGTAKSADGGVATARVVNTTSDCRFFNCLAESYASDSTLWYFTAPSAWYLGDLDWYRGELSYWISHRPALPAGDAGALHVLTAPPAYDLVLRAGPAESQLTLTWIHAEPLVGSGPRKYVVPFSNETCPGESINTPSGPYYPGCWMVAGETLASAAQIQYVVDNVTELLIRGKYLEGAAATTFLDEVKITAREPRIP